MLKLLNRILPDFEQWVFLSDSKGKCIGVKQLLVNSIITIDAPTDFQEVEFAVTYFSRWRPGTEFISNYRSFSTTTGHRPTEVTIGPATSIVQPGEIGESQWWITGAPADHEYFARLSGTNINGSNEMHIRDGIGFGITRFTDADPEDLFVIVEDIADTELANVKYKLIEDVTMDNNIDLNFNDLQSIEFNHLEYPAGGNFFLLQFATRDGHDPLYILNMRYSSDGWNDIPVAAPPDGLFDRLKEKDAVTKYLESFTLLNQH